MQAQVTGDGRRTRFGVASILAVVFIWSGWIIVSSWGLHQVLTAWDISFLRFTSAALVTLPLLLRKRHDLRAIFNWRTLVCALGCGFPYTMLSFIGLEHSPASNAGVVVNGLMPILVACFSFVLLKQRIARAKLLGIALIAVANGLILVDGGLHHFYGMLFFLLAALCLATYTVFMRLWNIPTDVMIVSVPWINAIVFFPIWLFLAPSTLHEAGASEIVLQVLYQGVLVSVIALYLMTHAIHALGSATASTFMGLVPVAAAGLALVILHEPVSALTAVAAITCSVGIVFYNLRGARSSGSITMSEESAASRIASETNTVSR
jgi:drug/metabolite transporter (DMT)-like permease